MSGLAEFLELAQPIVAVRISNVRGSSPREVGAFMLVAETALWGTVGGGQLEYMAIDEARALARSAECSRQMNVPLGPEIGQCCGGHVQLDLRVIDQAEKAQLLAQEAARMAALPEVLILGSGHIGRALAYAFAPLPVRAILVDSRAEELAHAPEGVEQLCTPLPELTLRGARAGAAYIVATHEHSLDFLLTSEALARGDAAYVGMIGSKTKRAKFESWTVGEVDQLVCPMAAAHKGDRRPEVIAAFVVAEVMARLAAFQDAVNRQSVRGKA
ncbi:xanthine dehydrogenase accessory protein XdhC [Lentibacter sp.]|uniref:xanthine dehydrogenase accessory protein XdhC n=1 Tax=Lentibacter sp. TaxID=2024994 RepID=UPI003F6B1D72